MTHMYVIAVYFYYNTAIAGIPVHISIGNTVLSTLVLVKVICLLVKCSSTVVYELSAPW